MGLLVIFLTVGFFLALLVGVVLAFILFVLHLMRKEDVIIQQYSRMADDEVSHGTA